MNIVETFCFVVLAFFVILFACILIIDHIGNHHHKKQKNIIEDIGKDK